MGFFDFLFGTPKVKETKFKIKTISEMTDSEKELLRAEFKKFKEAFDADVKARSLKIREEVAYRNSNCPKCFSKNVNNRIKRIEGEINGSSSGFGYSSIFGGSYHSSGSDSWEN
jgi:predicted transport protein